MNTVVAFVFFELLIIATFKISSGSGSTYVGCAESEREVLLRFKQDVKDPSNRLASWMADGDCCKWVGVVCNNLTGHVLELHLNNSPPNNEPTDTEDAEMSMLLGKINPSLVDLKYLFYLDMRYNKLEGPIPSSLGELSSLEYLDLSYNKLNGYIPSSLGKLSSLNSLDLRRNNLSGPFPSSFGKLSSLVFLYVSYNKLNGTLCEIHFVNLTNLWVFDVNENSLVLDVNPNWIPPFQLIELHMSSCRLGPQFPLWIYSQKRLSYLDISNSGIVDTIHNRFLNYSSFFGYLNFSHNQIYGEIPNVISDVSGATLDFSSNHFSGPLRPQFSLAMELDFSNNALTGPIFQFLCDERNKLKPMRVLNLRNNFLSRELPDCWTSFDFLKVLYLDNNNFIGNLPISVEALSRVKSLHLRKNSLSGTIPASLRNCTSLEVLDLGENEFVGNVPMWIGESFSSMRILNLHSNKFHGHLPLELCHLKFLQILDLASNDLSGTIPRCFNNFSAMVSEEHSVDNEMDHFVDYVGNITDDALLIVKGTGLEYTNTLNLVRIIDLSDNNFSGEIPMEMTDLIALQSLNISHNFLTGKIPENIGVMKSLEAIDLSANQLSGKMPESFSELNFLSYLNLSINNLTGKIPSSTQLQSFNASSYAGNDLCGPPLPKSCSVLAVPTPDHETGGDNTDDEHEVKWFFVSMVLGFVVGFWSMIGPLVVNRRWSYRYSLLLDHFVNKLCCFAK